MTSEETAPRSDNFRDHPWNPQEDFLDNTATNLARPVTDAVIMTVASLEERCKHGACTGRDKGC